MPRFHLRGFASDGGQLRQIDLDSGRQALVSIDDATVVKDFYTVVLADGTHSDVWETRLADWEAAVAPAVRRAIDADEWRPSSQERTNLASWIALQYLRGISNRRLIAHTRAQLVRMQVGMGGLGYLRHAMRVGLDRDVSEREAEAVWNDIHKPGGPTIRVSGDEHVASIAFSFEKAVETIGGRSWHRVRFTRRRLAINDTPVALIPGADHPSFLGLGLANASAITVALDAGRCCGSTILFIPTSIFRPAPNSLEPTTRPSCSALNASSTPIPTMRTHGRTTSASPATRVSGTERNRAVRQPGPSA